jgi:predicted ATPase
MGSTPRIVLTGGPGAGKSVVSRQLAADDPDRYALVPEAATQVYAALGTRWDRLDVAGRRDVQRRIYRLQVEQEARAASEHPGRVLLLDRGTVDGAAYWPEGPDAYWRDVGTTHAAELARYDAVVLLQTAAVLGADAYDGAASNACRYEGLDAAIANANLVDLMWRDHPRLVRVPAYATLEEKVARVTDVLRSLRA